MKVSSLLSFLAFSAVSAAPVHYQDIFKVADYLHAVVLPGDDYIAGGSIFPGRLIAGFSVGESEFANADDWGLYIVGQCATTPNCVGTSSFSGLNSGSTGGRYWFGYIYRGSSLTGSDFVEADAKSEVFGARAYTF